MATRSTITIKHSDGKFRSVYCHWDGYLDHNGQILLEHYNTQERVESLVEHGDISSLGKFCDKPEGHTFDKPASRDHTIYYGRDRGEAGTEAGVGDTAEAALKDGGYGAQGYNYLWDRNRWSVDGEDLAAAIKREVEED